MKRIVVIGGTSSLAQHLMPVLSKDNVVISMGRKNCDIHCDLLEKTDSFALPENADVVVHIAASFEGNTDEEIIKTEETNALGTLKVCMSVYKAKVKHLIVISSLSAVLDENSLYYNIYSISKRHSEELAVYYCSHKKIPLTILRPSQIYDEKGCFRKHQPLLYLMADNAQLGKDINIYGSNDALRNYIHVEDMVEIITRTIKTGCTGVYSCTNPKDVKLSDVAQGALSVFNKGGKIVFLNNKKDIPDNVFYNDTVLYEKIKFYPQIDLIAGMKKIYHYRMGNS